MVEIVSSCNRRASQRACTRPCAESGMSLCPQKRCSVFHSVSPCRTSHKRMLFCLFSLLWPSRLQGSETWVQQKASQKLVGDLITISGTEAPACALLIREKEERSVVCKNLSNTWYTCLSATFVLSHRGSRVQHALAQELKASSPVHGAFLFLCGHPLMYV